MGGACVNLAFGQGEGRAVICSLALVCLWLIFHSLFWLWDLRPFS
jgi:hypothetical protein